MAVKKQDEFNQQNPYANQTAGNPLPTAQIPNTDWQGQMASLMGQINDRKPFEFDLDKDGLYQQLKDQYTRLGQQAMKDTMGQAAGLTGGYSSSYAQNVGQQAYDDHLTKLNAAVPDLYAQARSAYDAEGADLFNRLNAAQGMYGLQRQAELDAQDQDYREWQMQMAELERQDNLDKASRSEARDYALMMLQMGLTPSADQLAAAGISAQDAAGIRNYYLQQQYAAGGTGGSGSDRGTNPKTPKTPKQPADDGEQYTPIGAFSRSLLPGGGLLGINDILNNGLNAVYDAFGAPRNSVPQNDLINIARLYATKGGDAALAELRRRYGSGYDLDTAWAWISNNWKRFGPSGQLAGYSRGERSFDFTT